MIYYGSLQWGSNSGYRYSQDIQPGQLRILEVDERLVLPTNTLIRLLVTASDVLHSWAVPSLVSVPWVSVLCSDLLFYNQSV